MIHIIETGDNEYLVIEPFSLKENHYSVIHYRSFSLDNARKYARMLSEDGVPVNAIAAGPGGGNIATIPYVMKFRQAIGRAKRKRR